MISSALLNSLTGPLQVAAVHFLRASPWLLSLWLLLVGVILIGRPFLGSARRRGRWQLAAAGMGLLLVLGAGLIGGSLHAQGAPPVPEAIPVPGTRPDGTVAPPAGESPGERVVPVLPPGPRRISC